MKFCKGEFDKLCKNEGIVWYHIVRMTPQQNGMSECINRTLLKRARCMISNVGLTMEFWAEAISMACYIINRTSCATFDFKTYKFGQILLLIILI